MILQSVEAILLRVAFGSIGAIMRDVGGHIIFSASDLMRFMGCTHATTLELASKAKMAQDALVVDPEGACHGAFRSIFPELVVQPSSLSAFEMTGAKHNSLVEQVSRAK